MAIDRPALSAFDGSFPQFDENFNNGLFMALKPFQFLDFCDVILILTAPNNRQNN